MTIGDIKNHIFRRTKTNATSFPAADMVIAINNSQERVETKIRTCISEYNFTRFTSGDLSTGTAVPKFHSLFHELIPLGVEEQYTAENNLPSYGAISSERQVKELEMERWYALHQFRVATVTIAAPGVVTLDNHGLQTNDRVIFETTGALPTGLSTETWYFVIRTGDHTLQLTATRDGAAITTTTSQSGTHFLGREQPKGFARGRVYDSNK
jgi:hypothetical protein